MAELTDEFGHFEMFFLGGLRVEGKLSPIVDAFIVPTCSTSPSILNAVILFHQLGLSVRLGPSFSLSPHFFDKVGFHHAAFVALHIAKVCHQTC